MNLSLLKQPSGYLPLAMSFAALALVVGHAAKYGVVHEVDEGTPAHLFQLLIAGQVPMVLYFAITGLPRSPRGTLQVQGLQAGAVLAAFAGVYFLT